MNVACIKTLLSWVGIILGLISAHYWWRSSTAKVNEPDPRYIPGVENLYADPDEPGKQIRINATTMKQSHLSKIASLYTAGAIICQAISTALP